MTLYEIICPTGSSSALVSDAGHSKVTGPDVLQTRLDIHKSKNFTIGSIGLPENLQNNHAS
jgi:hypothetical protein